MVGDSPGRADGAIVIDASVVVDVLTMPSARHLRAAIAQRRLHAPALIDYEVLSAIRGLARSGHLDQVRAGEALADYSDLPIVTSPGDADQRARIWSMRHNLTAYDAAYVALAARIERPLWTRDAKVVAGAGGFAQVVLV